MPTAVKIGSQHILISMFIAPISVILFSYLGGEFSESHDNGIKLDYLVQNVAEIKNTMDDTLPMFRDVKTRVHIMETELKYLKEQNVVEY